MRVLFDLRPRYLVQSQEQQIDPLRLFSVLLFFVFVVLSIFNIGYTALQLRQVRAELASTRGEQMLVADNAARLSATVTTMRKLRDRVRVYIDFTRQELPSVEFMAALEGATPDGLKITALEIRPGSVLMRGTALTDGDILEFGAKLDAMKSIVSKVDAPVTTKGELGTIMTSDFTITCNIRSLADIAASLPEPPPPAPVSEQGGDI